MSRDIKFRYVYKCSECGKITTRELTLEQIEGLHIGFESVGSVQCSCDKYGRNFAELTDRLQYTGLKDKNNVEIYVGDIVRYGVADFEVFVGRGGFGLQEMNSALSMKHGDRWITALMATFDTVEKCEALEIIGNIYTQEEQE